MDCDRTPRPLTAKHHALSCTIRTLVTGMGALQPYDSAAARAIVQCDYPEKKKF